MPRGDGTGPIGHGVRDGRGRRLGGKGQTSKGKGQGVKKGSRLGEVQVRRRARK